MILDFRELTTEPGLTWIWTREETVRTDERVVRKEELTHFGKGAEDSSLAAWAI